MGPASVEQHYTRGGLVEAIRAALRAAGKEPEHAAPADLAPVDEFHVRGREATLELAAKLEPKPGDRVLDIGSGLGGASRALAAAYGCRVTGIDLTDEYCRTAATLAGWVGLGGRAEYRQADALDPPFGAGTFDLAWAQHAAMNIADKARLYAEARRVLKPGGRFALHAVLQGRGGPAHFPVPWAREPAISHLVTPDELRRLLEGAGFEILRWRDTAVAGRDWYVAISRRIREGGLPPLGHGLLLGPGFAQMADNQRRNLEEDRIALVEAVCRKAAS